MSGPPRNAQSPERPTAGGGQAGGFSRAARLLKHADFERVYEDGQRHFARHMTVFFLRRPSGQARVGFTVGRVLGGAVERNRIKRRLRQAARLQWRRLSSVVDVVVNPKKSALQADFAEIEQELGQAFETISGKIRPRDGGQGVRKRV